MSAPLTSPIFWESAIARMNGRNAMGSRCDACRQADEINANSEKNECELQKILQWHPRQRMLSHRIFLYCPSGITKLSHWLYEALPLTSCSYTIDFTTLSYWQRSSPTVSLSYWLYEALPLTLRSSPTDLTKLSNCLTITYWLHEALPPTWRRSLSLRRSPTGLQLEWIGELSLGFTNLGMN